MSRFTKHFRMNEADAAEYVAEKLDAFAGCTNLRSTEIGDGNINYVFRVEDPQTGRSVILKHADTHSRSSRSELSTDRSRIEAQVLRFQGSVAPGFVPEVYLYDDVMCCLAMEDLRDYENMRYALIDHKIFPTFAEDITTFMAETLIRTTDNILNSFKKKELVGQYINPALCYVTERLVYTEPYTNHMGSNVLFEPNKDFLSVQLYGDTPLRLEAAKLKFAFESKPQALLHGDLHTGSIFVKPGSTKVLDPEFAFFGPIGYDVGNVVANLIFAWANATVTMAEGEEKATYLAWLEKTIAEVVDGFARKALSILQDATTDCMFATPGYAQWYVSDILADTAGVTGLELNRRIIGSAKVKDVAGIENVLQRILAERVCVLCAKRFILGRNTGFAKGEHYIAALRDCWREAQDLTN